MVSIGSNGQKIAYGIKHYNLDSEDDLPLIQTRNEKMGTTCFIIENSKYYMLNSQKEWIEITPFGKKVASDDSEGGTPDSPDDDDHIIYEGGVI